MSINAIEQALWQISVNPADAQSFREDAQTYLKKFRVNDEERFMVASWDVSGMLDRGVHPMVVLMAFGAIKGPAAMGEYMEKLHQPGQAVSH